MYRILLVGYGLLALLCVAGLTVASAHASSNNVITVNSTADTDICQGNTCTLRGAIDKANATADLDTIEFAIPTFPVAAGHCNVIDSTCLIAPASPLPYLQYPVIIDGYTQPGASANTLDADDNAQLRIILQGDNAGSVTSGLIVAGGNSTIQGLNIRGFEDGIIVASDNNLIAGNFIGTDVTGTQAASNRDVGVRLTQNHNALGGATVAARNVIAANEDAQVDVAGATLSVVQNNYIGVGANNKTFSPQRDGIKVYASEDAITIASMQVLVKGNRITGNLTGITIGNVATDESSAIALSQNSIYGNQALGIDLGSDGVTLNDKKDADSGVNDLQNFPVLKSAISNTGTTIVKGKLNSKPNTSYRIEIFVGTLCDGSGYGEATTYLGAVKVKTNAQGSASFIYTKSINLGTGGAVTATATQRVKHKLTNTSEISKCVPIHS